MCNEHGKVLYSPNALDRFMTLVTHASKSYIDVSLAHQIPCRGSQLLLNQSCQSPKQYNLKNTNTNTKDGS